MNRVKWNLSSNERFMSEVFPSNPPKSKIFPPVPNLGTKNPILPLQKFLKRKKKVSKSEAKRSEAKRSKSLTTPNGSSSEIKHEDAERGEASPLGSTSRRFVSTPLLRRFWLRRSLIFLLNRCSFASSISLFSLSLFRFQISNIRFN